MHRGPMLAISQTKLELRREAKALRLLGIFDDGHTLLEVAVLSRRRLRRLWRRLLSAARAAAIAPIPSPAMEVILDCLVARPTAAVSARKLLWLAIRRDRLTKTDYMALAHQQCRDGIRFLGAMYAAAPYHQLHLQQHNLLLCRYANASDEDTKMRSCCPVAMHCAEPQRFFDSAGHQAIALASFPWKHQTEQLGGFDAEEAAQAVAAVVAAREPDGLAESLVGCVLVQPKMAVWVVCRKLTATPPTFSLRRIKPSAYSVVFGPKFAGMAVDELAAAWQQHWSPAGEGGVPGFHGVALRALETPGSCSATLHAKLGPAIYDDPRGGDMPCRSLKFWLPNTDQEFVFARFEHVPVRCRRTGQITQKQRLRPKNAELRFVFGTPPVVSRFVVR